MGLIAEVKRASPSAGVIKADFEPQSIAAQYIAAGANCLSILTDEPFFHGRLEYLTQIRRTATVPLLRKDFLIDRIRSTRLASPGPTAVLLIAECLDDEELPALYGTDSRTRHARADRDLRAGESRPRAASRSAAVRRQQSQPAERSVDLDHTTRLGRNLPPSTLLVSESGIKTRADVEQLKSHGVGAILVGETLMRASNIGAMVRELVGPPAKDAG